MKKIILLSFTTLLLIFNCFNNQPPIPCNDGICLTDEQLNFFKMHLEDDTLTKKVLFEMSSMDLRSKEITSLDRGIFNNLTNLRSIDLTDNIICVDKVDVGLAEAVTLTFDGWNCLTDQQVKYFADNTPLSITNKQQLYGVSTLNFSNKGIIGLSPGIFDNLTNLTHLSLYNNRLTSLPAGIFDDLTNLTHLDLYNNQLTTFPTGIFNKLTNLTNLGLQIIIDTNNLMILITWIGV